MAGVGLTVSPFTSVPVLGSPSWAPASPVWLPPTVRGYASTVTDETGERVDRLARAMGIVAIQAGCTLGDALSMLVDRAQINRFPLEDIASAVVDGAIRFDD